ncbi:arsenate reductase [uncultured Cohaesibacter sp.]|uniref:arsenate reductase n=1 Tax=uncultured Cohaesibacter sp. TaxID=1002546 RepID=UPI00292EFA4F|nr:arsenate reductase [uncultured Cohaesibacter sp.]
MKLYGIKTCDTCRKALTFLQDGGVDATFVDFRKDGLPETELDHWLDAVGWEKLLNRRSTSWRALEEADKADITRDKARALMLANPTLIKRPVFAMAHEIIVGFGKEEKQRLMSRIPASGETPGHDG